MKLIFFALPVHMMYEVGEDKSDDKANLTSVVQLRSRDGIMCTHRA